MMMVTHFQRGQMKQLLLNEEEHNDLASALEQVGDIYELKVRELERSITVANQRIDDLRKSKETVEELRTKVTLAEEIQEELEMSETDEPIPPDDYTPTHTICMCDVCVGKRHDLITDDSIEQME